MEEKRLMKCTSCQSQYNVSKFQPGTKFRCAKCGTINVVAQAAAETPAPEPEPAPAQPAAPVRPTTTGKIVPKSSISSKRLAAAPGGLRKTGLGVKAVAPAAGAGDEMGGIQVKKSKTKYYIIGIVAVVVIGIVIYMLSSSGSTEEEDYDDEDNKKTEKTEKKDKKDKKTEDKKTEEKKTGEGAEEKKPEDKKTEEPKEEPKKTEKKGGFEVDETVRKEVWDILKEMDKQKDEAFDNSKKTIMDKGKKAIPTLILAIGIDDDSDTGKQMARYASDILKKMTNWEDAPNVNPLIGKSMRKDICEEWKEWWKDNQDKFKD
jgi:predicted RNA-binding Zn-ribbon protein involved in translation (DUF1610 family)